MGERVKRLKQWRDQRGMEMGLDPALICTNAQIRTLAVAHPRHPDDIGPHLGIKAWQKAQFGSEICDRLKSL